jgi:hypothetical protein
VKRRDTIIMDDLADIVPADPAKFVRWCDELLTAPLTLVVWCGPYHTDDLYDTAAHALHSNVNHTTPEAP